VFPWPVSPIFGSPESKAPPSKMGVAIGKMVAEDPTFRVNTDIDSGKHLRRHGPNCNLEQSRSTSWSATLRFDLLLVQSTVAIPREQRIKPRSVEAATRTRTSPWCFPSQYGKIDVRQSSREANTGFTFKVTGDWRYVLERNPSQPSRRASPP